jgi:hypothetical protein
MLLQFLDRGLKDGERVAFLGGSTAEETIEQARSWGIELGEAWRDGRFTMIGYRDEYPSRAMHSPDPGELFSELRKLIGRPVSRLGIDPGNLLWDARGDASMAGSFVAWTRELGATVMAAVPLELDDGQRAPAEWVAQRARGVFQITAIARGLHELEIVRLAPPVKAGDAIALELTEGLGLVRPSGNEVGVEFPRPDTDRLVILVLGVAISPDVEGWLKRRFSVDTTTDSRDCIGRLRSGQVGALCVYTGRGRIVEAISTGRAARESSDAVLLLLADEPLRASDAARALDAGFDDVLSGVVDLRELESRFRRAAETQKTRPIPETARPAPASGPLSEEEFRSVVLDRMTREGMEEFSLLHLEGPAGDEIGSLLFANVRAGEGDVVGPVHPGWGVLLQNARSQQAESFLQRLRTSIADAGGPLPLSAEIFASPDQSESIQALLADPNPAREGART